MRSLASHRSRCRPGSKAIGAGISLALVVCLLLLPPRVFAGGVPRPNSSPGVDRQHLPWEHLHYHAQNWAVELSIDLRLSRLPSAAAETALLDISPEVPLKASGKDTLRLTLDMTMDPTFRRPVRIHNRVWFNPGDAGALGRYRLRRGEDDFEKTYRFARKGVFRRNREPRGQSEARRDPDKWSRQVASFYPFDRERLGCPAVLDRLLLIYIAADFERIEAAQPFSVCVFGKRQLHRVTLRPDGREAIAVDFIETRATSQARRMGQVEALKIKLTTEPLASDLDEPENFSFLGLHKNIVIYVDPRSGLPLQVSGRITNIAAGDLKLLKAVHR